VGRQDPEIAYCDPLPELLGRSRAEILAAVTLPCCTTDLATSIVGTRPARRAGQAAERPGAALSPGIAGQVTVAG